MRAVFANKRAAYLLDDDGTLLDILRDTIPVAALKIGRNGQLLHAWFLHLQRLRPMWPDESFKLRIRQGNKRASAEVHV